MLQVLNLKYKNILQNISFSLKEGDICGVFGPSGGGKSTLISIIKNFQNGWSGTITYQGTIIDQFDKNIGYVLQESIFFSSLTLLENLKLTEAEDEEIREILIQMKLLDLLEKQVDVLSGGQKQRLSIARCLLMKPKVLLMDEPTSALDPENAYLTLKVVEKYIKESNSICLIISHNIYNTEIYNKLLYLKNGMVEYFGEDINYLKSIQ